MPEKSLKFIQGEIIALTLICSEIIYQDAKKNQGELKSILELLHIVVDESKELKDDEIIAGAKELLKRTSLSVDEKLQKRT